ncbi:MAG TPA: hypothetical protein VIJ94_15925 [Caulobacteraceae bacterium]
MSHSGQCFCGAVRLEVSGEHVNYAETVLPMHDGLPKFRDFPAAFGGSDEMVAE